MALLKNNFYPLLKLAIPLAITGLLQSATYFFETLFLAHLNPDALAAGALVSWLYGDYNCGCAYDDDCYRLLVHSRTIDFHRF